MGGHHHRQFYNDEDSFSRGTGTSLKRTRSWQTESWKANKRNVLLNIYIYNQHCVARWRWQNTSLHVVKTVFMQCTWNNQAVFDLPIRSEIRTTDAHAKIYLHFPTNYFAVDSNQGNSYKNILLDMWILVDFCLNKYSDFVHLCSDHLPVPTNILSLLLWTTAHKHAQQRDRVLLGRLVLETGKVWLWQTFSHLATGLFWTIGRRHQNS